MYLLMKNLKTKRKTKRLDHVKVGPFLIAKQKGVVSYRLELPPDAALRELEMFAVDLSRHSSLHVKVN